MSQVFIFFFSLVWWKNANKQETSRNLQTNLSEIQRRTEIWGTNTQKVITVWYFLYFMYVYLRLIYFGKISIQMDQSQGKTMKTSTSAKTAKPLLTNHLW